MCEWVIAVTERGAIAAEEQKEKGDEPQSRNGY